MSKSLKNTVNLLVMLHDANRKNPLKKTLEDKAEFDVKLSLLKHNGLTMSEFLNEVNKIGDKGYIQHVAVFDDEYKQKVREELESGKYEEAVAKIDENEKLSRESIIKIRLAMKKELEKILPKGVKVDLDKFVKETPDTLGELLRQAKSFVEEFIQDDFFARVVVLPYRNLKKLQEQLEKNIPLKDIVDDGLWHDHDTDTLFLNNKIYSQTKHNGEPLKRAFVFRTLFDSPEQDIDYVDVEGYDIRGNLDRNKENKRYHDMMRKYFNTKKARPLKKHFCVSISSIKIVE